jgi:hypothetical protein
MQGDFISTILRLFLFRKITNKNKDIEFSKLGMIHWCRFLLAEEEERGSNYEFSYSPVLELLFITPGFNFVFLPVTIYPYVYSF